MFHKPAHRDTTTPPGQIVNPIPAPAPTPAPQQPTQSALPDIDLIIRYESGELTEEEGTAFFQDGIDRGWVWRLQGHYGRMAQSLIAAGHCTSRRLEH